MARLFHGNLRWLLIFWMFLMSAIAYLDRVNVSIAGTAIQKEFNLTNVQLGYVFSAFVIGYALFQAPGGRLADKYGPRLVITWGVVWWGVFTTATALVPTGLGMSLSLLIATRFLLGLGEAVVYPSSNRLVAAWIPSLERGLANGLIFAGVGAGAGITPPLITWVLTNWGWHMSFYVCAGIGLVAGLGWFILARDTPRSHPGAAPPKSPTSKPDFPRPPGRSNRAPHCHGAPSSPTATSSSSRSATSPSATSHTSSSPGSSSTSTASAAWISNKARSIPCCLSSPWPSPPRSADGLPTRLTRRFGNRVGRCGQAAFGMLLSAVFIALATQVESATVASFVLAGGAGALYVAQSAFWAVVADIAGSSSGSASGLMNMVGQIGGATTASLTPLIADRFGWTESFLTAAALCAVGGLAWLTVRPDRPIGHPGEAA